MTVLSKRNIYVFFLKNGSPPLHRTDTATVCIRKTRVSHTNRAGSVQTNVFSTNVRSSTKALHARMYAVSTEKSDTVVNNFVIRFTACFYTATSFAASVGLREHPPLMHHFRVLYRIISEEPNATSIYLYRFQRG